MSISDDFLEMERELLERNRAIDERTAEVLRKVGGDADTPSPEASPSAPSSTAAAPPAQPATRAAANARAAPSRKASGSHPASAAGPADPLVASRVAALEQELRQMAVKLQNAERDRDKHAEDSGKQTKIVASLTAKIEKDRQAKEEALEKAKQADSVVLNLKRDITSLKKSLKLQETNANGKDARLQRALEELEKAKASSQTQSVQRENTDGLKEQVAKLQAENRRLQGQKQELLAGFKKQAKLIDILKRQKMHVEAAKLLSFTEEEFVRTMDLGEAVG